MDAGLKGSCLIFEDDDRGRRRRDIGLQVIGRDQEINVTGPVHS